MQIQIRHDEHLRGDKHGWIESTVESALTRYGAQITTVEVHLADEDGAKNSEGATRCTLEIRVGGFKPFAVTAHGDHVGMALDSALTKADHHLEHQLGRVRDVHTRRA